MAIIGAGQMGAGMAQYLAMNNVNVTLVDYKENNIKRASEVNRNSLNRLLLKEKISELDLVAIQNRIHYSITLSACREMDLVIEAIREDIEKKEKLLIELNGILKQHTIVATNTSSLSITKLGALFKDPSKVIGLRFFNPAVIMRSLK